jgi:ATP-dependent protease ClpP protease subunit
LKSEWALYGLALSMAAVLVMAGRQGWRMLRRATPQDIVWESRA